MISYDILTLYLKNNLYENFNGLTYSKKPLYTVIIDESRNYHITIYQDQWDDYEWITRKPYYLFHVSSNSSNNLDRCSSYFWVNKTNYHIRKIPSKYFMYNQPTFDFMSSTRNPCKLSEIIPLLKKFQKIINAIIREQQK